MRHTRTTVTSRLPMIIGRLLFVARSRRRPYTSGSATPRGRSGVLKLFHFPRANPLLLEQYLIKIFNLNIFATLGLEVYKLGTRIETFANNKSRRKKIYSKRISLIAIRQSQIFVPIRLFFFFF